MKKQRKRLWKKKERREGGRKKERENEERGRKQQRHSMGFDSFDLDGGKQGKGEDEHPVVRQFSCVKVCLRMFAVSLQKVNKTISTASFQ